MKKLLVLILAALMVTSFAACSDKEGEDVEDLKNYLEEEVIIDRETIAETGETFIFARLDSESVVITAYQSGDEKHALKIPETLDGKKVKAIATQAFKDCTSVTSLELPATLETIGDYAFANCSLITSLHIPANVTSIGVGAFVRCNSIETLTFAEGINLKVIATDTFRECSALTAVTIPASVTKIEATAFMKCTNLASVTIPEGVTSIGAQAFQNCDALATLVLPKSLAILDEYYVFSGSKNLTNVYYNGTAEDWANIRINTFNQIGEAIQPSIMDVDNTLKTLTLYLYSETQPEPSTDPAAPVVNYWHYVDGVVTAW